MLPLKDSLIWIATAKFETCRMQDSLSRNEVYRYQSIAEQQQQATKRLTKWLSIWQSIGIGSTLALLIVVAR